jgi:hypothetical protein
VNFGKFLAAGLLVALAAHDDEILGTGQCAQVAGDAQCLVGVGMIVQARGSAKALGYLRPLQRILFGVDVLRVLVAEGDLQPRAEDRREDAMRTYLSKLSPTARMALAIPLLMVAYPVVMIVLPCVVRAIVPNVVRSVLSLM